MSDYINLIDHLHTKSSYVLDDAYYNFKTNYATNDPNGQLARAKDAYRDALLKELNLNADKLLFLNDFLKVKIISDKVGDASKLKLLRSTYTKALSVLLMESYALAQKLNLEDEFFDTLSLTEGDEFKDKSLSRINNTLNSSKRKAEELEEILNYFNDDDLKMIKTALLKLKQF